VQQQHGTPPKHTQHMQPAFMQPAMQSQQACIISQQCLSPEVQVMHTPSLVISHRQLHMAKLHWHMTSPFIMHEQLHMPPASIRQMFCNVPQDISSSHEQVILRPPAHFSIFILHCGTMAVFIMPGAMPGAPAIDIEAPGIPAAIGRSTIIIVIADSFRLRGGRRNCDVAFPLAACTGRHSFAVLWSVQSDARCRLNRPPVRRVGFSLIRQARIYHGK
jgi:hypothetical protein